MRFPYFSLAGLASEGQGVGKPTTHPQKSTTQPQKINNSNKNKQPQKKEKRNKYQITIK